MYALYIHLQCSEVLTIGSLGSHWFQVGNYLYIGSARGPGGIRARVNRHLRPEEEKHHHWHIDTLLYKGRILEVWWRIGSPSSECEWAESMAEIGDRSPPRFGASDCRCPGHLIYLGDQQAAGINYGSIMDVTRVSINP